MQRIVSLVPSVTETLFDLQQGHRVVGVTRYCEEPAAALQDMPRVGGTKNPDLEKIAGLQPDLVLVNTEENRSEDIDWLRQRFAVLESMPRCIDDVAEALRELGRCLDCEDATAAMIFEMQAQITRAEVEGLDADPIRVFYAIWKKPWMSINGQTYIHDLLAMAGAFNVCEFQEERYPSFDLDDLPHLGAELVLLPSEPWAFSEEERRQCLQDRLFGDVPLLMVDGRDFCWHGSRTAPGLARAHDLLLPHRRSSGL